MPKAVPAVAGSRNLPQPPCLCFPHRAHPVDRRLALSRRKGTRFFASWGWTICWQSPTGRRLPLAVSPPAPKRLRRSSISRAGTHSWYVRRRRGKGEAHASNENWCLRVVIEVQCMVHARSSCNEAEGLLGLACTVYFSSTCWKRPQLAPIAGSLHQLFTIRTTPLNLHCSRSLITKYQFLLSTETHGPH